MINNRTLSVISYNIWFSDYALKERLVGLIATLLEEDADVVCLQEVRRDVYGTLIKNLNKYEYHYPDTITYRYGCAIFSKHKLSNCVTHPFYSSMGRSLIVVQIDCDESMKELGLSELVVATTHFESLFSNTRPNFVKLDQYTEAKDILNQYKNVIFCSDTNIMDHEEGNFIQTGTWKDAWKEKGTNQNEFTYDGQNNVFLLMENCRYRSRLDRILYRFGTTNLVISNFKLVDGIDGFTVPSDHSGVFARFGKN